MTKGYLISCSVAALCGSLAVSLPARAQRVGTYSGFQSNGQPISLTVSRYKGRLIVDFINVQVQTTCRNGQSLDEDTGYGAVGPIVDGSGQDSFNFGAAYFTESFTFDQATRSVSGFVQVVSAEFVPPPPGSTSPPKPTYCTIGKQAYAAVFGKDVPFDPHASVVRYQRPDR